MNEEVLKSFLTAEGLHIRSVNRRHYWNQKEGLSHIFHKTGSKINKTY